MDRCAATLPDEITVGLDFQARVVLPAYPAPTWALQAVIRGPQPIDLTATADGAAHVFAADAATNTSWAAGMYWYSVRATSGGAALEVGKGRLQIVRDLAAITGPYDGRSPFEIGLEAIDAVLSRRATQDQQRYVINKRELWRTPIHELLKLRAYYASKVRRERGGGLGRQIPVRFS